IRPPLSERGFEANDYEIDWIAVRRFVIQKCSEKTDALVREKDKGARRKRRNRAVTDAANPSPENGQDPGPDNGLPMSIWPTTSQSSSDTPELPQFNLPAENPGNDRKPQQPSRPELTVHQHIDGDSERPPHENAENELRRRICERHGKSFEIDVAVRLIRKELARSDGTISDFLLEDQSTTTNP